MAEAGKVDAHLMRASGEDLHFKQRKAPEPAEDSITAERGADTGAGPATGRHPRATQPVPADRRGNLSLLGSD